ncbi:hypothetical protein KZ810_07130 [Sphingomonas sp. RHCKR47]|uniref:hypothetical protein n=1 Tax=Sphingomonas citricola TaxID=2862498 RepID=UPI001CA46F02|nr:hypothetical protein [Sphingomonas citricola]MBW6523270.1 hypothetical protein [Sphingomonas citricola]
MSANHNDEEVQFCDVKRVAELTGISKGHLVKLRLYDPKNSPPFFRVGRRVLYPLNGPRGLGSWAAARMQTGAAL